jgi:hypothetical protein
MALDFGRWYVAGRDWRRGPVQAGARLSRRTNHTRNGCRRRAAGVAAGRVCGANHPAARSVTSRRNTSLRCASYSISRPYVIAFTYFRP